MAYSGSRLKFEFQNIGTQKLSVHYCTLAQFFQVFLAAVGIYFLLIVFCFGLIYFYYFYKQNSFS